MCLWDMVLHHSRYSIYLKGCSAQKTLLNVQEFHIVHNVHARLKFLLYHNEQTYVMMIVVVFRVFSVLSNGIQQYKKNIHNI